MIEDSGGGAWIRQPANEAPPEAWFRVRRAIMAPPMPISRTDAARLRRALRKRALTLPLAFVVTLAACAAPAPNPSSALGASPTPSPTPKPTPLPTPLFSNSPDAALTALIPTQLAGKAVEVPPITDFAYTPGDVGEAYGEVGLRFISLQVAYISQPRLSLYAIRMRPPLATNADLEPYLAAAGEYVGIAGLHREPWQLGVVGGSVVWWRPEDEATLKGTRVYTWAVDGLVFLMIGVDEAQNLAMLAALPGVPPPSPTPLPSVSGTPGATPTGSPS